MQTLFKTIRQYVRDHQDETVFYGMSALFGMLGALTMTLMVQFFIKDEPNIATVNITGLVDRFIKQEADKNLSPEVLKNEVKQYGMNLNKELQRLAKEKHLVLMPSEAVIAGSHDYTSYVKHRLLDRDEN